METSMVTSGDWGNSGIRCPKCYSKAEERPLLTSFFWYCPTCKDDLESIRATCKSKSSADNDDWIFENPKLELVRNQISSDPLLLDPKPTKWTGPKVAKTATQVKLDEEDEFVKGMRAAMDELYEQTAWNYINLGYARFKAGK